MVQRVLVITTLIIAVVAVSVATSTMMGKPVHATAGHTVSLFTITKRNVAAVAAAPTTGVIPAGAEVSAEIASLFGPHTKDYQALSAQENCWKTLENHRIAEQSRRGDPDYMKDFEYLYGKTYGR
jgi:hypothetical protein